MRRPLGSKSWVTKDYLDFITFKVIDQCPAGNLQNMFKFICEEFEILKSFDRTQLINFIIGRAKTQTEVLVSKSCPPQLEYAAPF